MRYIKALFLVVIISLCFSFLIQNKADPDLWGHLKFGQYIYENREIPKYDIYSYSSRGAPWINHEWLSELVFYVIFKYSGSAGLILFKLAIGIFITLFISNSISRSTDSIFLHLSSILLLVSVMSYGFATRPQVFTYLFFAVMIFLLDKFEHTGGPQWLRVFPACFLLWCNLHGGFAAGIAVLILYLVFKIFKKSTVREVLAISACSVLATLINPYGFMLWRFLAKAIPMHRPFIDEWMGVGFSTGHLDYFAILFFAIIGLTFSKTRRPLYETVILAIVFLISFRHNRHIVLFAILAAIYVPKHIDSLWGSGFVSFEKRLPRSFFIAFLLLISALFFSETLRETRMKPFHIEISAREYPVNGVRFIRDNHIGGNIFCLFDWAEMCIWELPETNKVFFDGRFETVYSDSLIKNYFDVLLCRKDYKDFLSRFSETDIMFLAEFLPLAKALSADREWVEVYRSPLAVIFLKNNPRNRAAIDRFRSGGFVYPSEKSPFYLT